MNLRSIAKALSANRVALYLHYVLVVLTAVGLFLAAISHSLPHAWQATLAIVIGIVGALVAGTTTVIKFLDGSQKYDALQAAGMAVSPDRASLAEADSLEHPEVPDHPDPQAWLKTRTDIIAETERAQEAPVQAPPAASAQAGAATAAATSGALQS